MEESSTVPAAPVNTRAHPRYEVSLLVDCSTRDVFVSSQFCNISRGGMFIPSDTPLPLDAEVAVVLRLPGPGRSIRARGRVVWNYDVEKGTTRVVPGSGIRFVDMAAEDLETLEGFLVDLGQLPR
jgi:uncharacterized protein (TIGR02266 family)